MEKEKLWLPKCIWLAEKKTEFGIVKVGFWYKEEKAISDIKKLYSDVNFQRESDTRFSFSTKNEIGWLCRVNIY